MMYSLDDEVQRTQNKIVALEAVLAEVPRKGLLNKIRRILIERDIVEAGEKLALLIDFWKVT